MSSGKSVFQLKIFCWRYFCRTGDTSDHEHPATKKETGEKAKKPQGKIKLCISLRASQLESYQKASSCLLRIPATCWHLQKLLYSSSSRRRTWAEKLLTESQSSARPNSQRSDSRNQCWVLLGFILDTPHKPAFLLKIQFFFKKPLAHCSSTRF